MPSVFKNTRLNWIEINDDYVAEEEGGQSLNGASLKSDEKTMAKLERNIVWVLGMNACAYPVNFMVVYLMGIHGFFTERHTLPELTTMVYPSLFSPDEWIFHAFHVIFLAQLVWLILPMTCYGERDVELLHLIGLNYIIITAAQVGYYVSFMYGFLWLALLFISILCLTLFKIFTRLNCLKPPNFGAYLQWYFPFAVHLGVVVPLAAYQLNLVTRLLTDEAFRQEEYQGEPDRFTEMLFLGLGIFASLSLALLLVKLNEFVVPSTILAYFVSVYFELERYTQNQLIQDYGDRQINFTKYTCAIGSVMIALYMFLTLWSQILCSSTEKAEEDVYYEEAPDGSLTKIVVVKEIERYQAAPPV